ncbi:MAG TPA: cytochrome c oxidase assembly factor Coa1 family protein, partial [Xanthomonadaceae bacterium]
APPAPPPPPPPPAPDIKASKDFKALMQLVVADAGVRAKLGTPVSAAEGVINGNLHLDNGEGDADLRFRLKGPKGTAAVHLVADMNDGAWSLESVDLD